MTGRARSGRTERRRKGKAQREDARREELVQCELIKLLGKELGGARRIASGREASVILAEKVMEPGGPEWMKLARERAEVFVDARTRSGVPLARFTDEEEAAWSAQEEERDEGTVITPDFHGDVDFITCFD